MLKDKYLEKIEVNGEIYYVRNNPSFFSDPLDWLIRKIKLIYHAIRDLYHRNDFEDAGVLFSLFNFLFCGFVCWYLLFEAIYLPVSNINTDKTPNVIKGPFELYHYRIPGSKNGENVLTILKDGWGMRTICLGLSESYCGKDVRGTKFSDEYIVEYVVRYKQTYHPSRALVSSIRRISDEKNEIIFENNSLQYFLYTSIYLKFLVLLPFFILVFKWFRQGFSRLIYLFRR